MAAADPLVTITMSADTVAWLSDDGSSLYSFKAVQSSSRSGRPLVWSRIEDYSATTLVSWAASYQAYTSSSAIAQAGVVRVGFAAAISPGQTLNVDARGIGTVVAGGPPTALSFLNQTTDPCTCGISQAQNGGDFAPYCAFPLNGLNEQSVVPLEMVLLMFSTDVIAPGTVITGTFGGATFKASRASAQFFAAVSPGFLIDLTGAAGNMRSVSFDVNLGWDCGNCTWGQSVPANANLVPLLIQPP